jgi:hypothetical protein
MLLCFANALFLGHVVVCYFSSRKERMHLSFSLRMNCKLHSKTKSKTSSSHHLPLFDAEYHGSWRVKRVEGPDLRYFVLGSIVNVDVVGVVFHIR